MRENRNEERSPSQTLGAPIVAAESLRNSLAAPEPAPSAKGEERISLFWRVFGGTLLSIAALLVITVCQHFNGSLNELRNDLDHLNRELRKDMGHLAEAQADLMKKEEFNFRMKSVWDSLKELQDNKVAFTALRERSALMQDRLKEAEEARKDLVREVQCLREVKAGEEARKDFVQELQRIRERLAKVEGSQTAGSSAVKPAVHRED